MNRLSKPLLEPEHDPLPVYKAKRDFALTARRGWPVRCRSVALRRSEALGQQQGVRDGNLKVEPHGHKLHGRWVLVRIEGRGEK